jgi:hypothetical protein
MNGTGLNTGPKNATLYNSLIRPLNMMNAAVQNTAANIGTSTGLSSYLPSWSGAFGIFIFLALIGVFIGLMVYFKDQINESWKTTQEVLSNAFKGKEADAAPVAAPPSDSTMPSESMGEAANIVEKVLPSGGNEVFNVSSNKYTYYDAQPLCKALGAELATYEQVKEAWDRGADWCNYGWVKGQMAVYPTSDETYAKLQSGPEEQRMSCGLAGVNGGYFDNPEMRFGVNCYGKKPAQSQHDQRELAKNAPLSPDALAFDKKVNQYKSEVDAIGVNPFNTNRWSN